MMTSVSHSPGPAMPTLSAMEARSDTASFPYNNLLQSTNSDVFNDSCTNANTVIAHDYDSQMNNYSTLCDMETIKYDYDQCFDDDYYARSTNMNHNSSNYFTQRSGSFGGQTGRYNVGIPQNLPLRETYSNNPLISNYNDITGGGNPDCVGYTGWRVPAAPSSPFITSTPIKQGDILNKTDYLLQKPMTMDSFYRIAQERGYIVGNQLERVLQRSSRSNATINNKILSQFKNRYGEVDSKTRSAYMQLGVRVPSKDHVSEIVGKGGSKIKTLRDETGALITTPGEHEDHVFIIEAPPQVALKVADHLYQRSEEITFNKTTDRRRNSGTNSGLGGHRKVLIKDKISVPQDLVGKIIGTQGSIITTIQRDTGTEIRSPPKDITRDPKGTADFEIATYENSQMSIEEAKRRIYIAKQFIAHLVVRQFEKAEEEETGGHNLDMPSSIGGIDMNENWPHSRPRGSQGSNDPSPTASSNFNIMTHWKWPEIQPMPLDEARAVIDRILNESKNKTRKESPESPEAPSFPNVMRPSATPVGSGVMGMNSFRGDLSLNALANGPGMSSGGYFTSPLNETMPSLFNSNHLESRSAFNTTIGTTDGSDLIRDYPRCDSGSHSNGTGNATPFNQWTSYHSNVRFGGSQSAFDPPQSIGGGNGSISFGRSIPESLETLTCGPRASADQQQQQQGSFGGSNFCPSSSITYPNGDCKISGLDALSQQLHSGLSFHSQRRGTYPTPTINEDPYAAQFTSPFTASHHHNHLFGDNTNHRNYSMPTANSGDYFMPPTFKRFHDSFTFSNDSGFESISNGGGSAGGCYRSADTCSVITSVSAQNGTGSNCNAPMSNFLDQHSLILDKNNPWRTNSFSNIDPLQDFTSTEDASTPVPVFASAKVGIIGDGRKKTPSPQLQNFE